MGHLHHCRLSAGVFLQWSRDRVTLAGQSLVNVRQVRGAVLWKALSLGPAGPARPGRVKSGPSRDCGRDELGDRCWHLALFSVRPTGRLLPAPGRLLPAPGRPASFFLVYLSTQAASPPIPRSCYKGKSHMFWKRYKKLVASRDFF